MADPAPRAARRRRWPLFVAVPGLLIALLIVVLVLFWQWDWFIPLVDARASAALGRPVRIAHLHVSLGRIVAITADDVRIGNPANTPAALPPLAQIAHLTLHVDAGRYLKDRAVVIPLLDLDTPKIDAAATADGADNFTFSSTAPAPAAGQAKPSTPEIDLLTIEHGAAHVVVPRLKADLTLTLATHVAAQPELVIDAKGRYAGQPIIGHLVSGTVLALQDAAHPFPVDLQLANGATRIRLTGTLNDPIHFAGANLKLSLAGANMADLTPLTGIPIPKTPGYHVSGQLHYADRRIHLTAMQGVVGNSDVEGSLAVAPGARETVTADLQSRSVDLADLGGFIGSEPGSKGGANQTAQQRAAVARAEASPKLLPNTPINLPALKGADIHLKYHAAHVKGRSIPFDTLNVALDIVDGHIDLHPVSLGVGAGAISGDITLDPASGKLFHTKAKITLHHVDVSRLMAATHAFSGAGSLDGSASIVATGNSLASLLAHGDGTLDLSMHGGSLSALLVDLAGLEFGKAVLSAIGLPHQATIACLIGDFTLKNGVLFTRRMLLDTSESVIDGTGTIDLANERLRYVIRTRSKHFSIGSLPAPMGIGGTFKHPQVGPDLVKLGLRGGAAVGLGFLAGPLALLPTIQFGVGEKNRCAALQTAPAK